MVKKGDEEGVKELLDEGADANEEGKAGTTPFDRSRKERRPRGRSTPDRCRRRWSTTILYSRTALMEAAIKKDSTITEILLEAGAVVDARDLNHRTASDVRRRRGCLSGVVHVLLTAGGRT